MQKLFTKTVYIGTSNQFEQFSKLKIGQWVKGISLNGKAQVFRGQFMGFDNDNMPIINFRIDNAKKKLDWKEQFKSNAPLRAFARIKC
jgi:hypothetical protein